MGLSNRPVSVLLVDDDEDDYALVKDLLHDLLHARFDLEWISEYQAAMRAIQSGAYDVCLLDYELGARSGMDILCEANERGCRIPIIFLTGQGDYELDLEAMRAGAADYLTKDYLTPALLERSIRYVMDRAKKKNELLKAERVIRALSECNYGMIRINDEMELLREVCRIVVDVGGYGMSWVGYIGASDAPGVSSLTPVASYGLKEGSLDPSELNREDLQRAREAVNTSMHTGVSSAVCLVQDQRLALSGDTASAEQNYASAISLPLFLYGQILGALVIYAEEADVFDSDEVELLTKLSGNLSYGIGALRVHQAHMRARESLRRAHDHLEREVEERTVELLRVNAELKREIEERKQVGDALRQSEEHYRSLFDNMLNGFAYCKLLFEEDQPSDFVYLSVNNVFEDLTGLKDVVGKRVTELIPGIRESDPHLFEIYARVAMSGRPERFETYVASLGMWFSVAVYSPQSEHFVAVFDVITERKEAEQALRNSLEEKEALLKEVHHRVKNNLQIVASLLGLQANRSQSRQVVEVLRDTRNRVRSMALLHEALYRSGNLARISYDSYVRDLCGQLMQSYGSVVSRVSLEKHIAQFELPLELAVPCGLIINELVSNALKHGFPGERTGRITVELSQTHGQMLALKVCDDGVGLPPRLDPSSLPTLGLKMVSKLADQLNGQFTIMNMPQGAGAGFRVVFPVPGYTLSEGEA